MGTPWVLGFVLGNWVSLKGLKQGEIVSIRKNVWGLSGVMATYILQSTVEGIHFPLLLTLKKKKKKTTLKWEIVWILRSLFKSFRKKCLFLLFICCILIVKQIIQCICIQTPRKSQTYYSCPPRSSLPFGVKTGNTEAKWGEDEWHTKGVFSSTYSC